MISKIALIGGTHGNERVGVDLINYYSEHKNNFSTFTVNTMIANPKAVKQNQRFTEQDLNRCFMPDDLNQSSKRTYEQFRAKELRDILGSKESPHFDFLIDIHSTNASMGQSLIVEYPDPYVLRMCKILQDQLPNVHIILSDYDKSISVPFITGLNYRSLLIEVGPIVQGIQDHHQFLETKRSLLLLFSIIEEMNKTDWPFEAFKTTVYQPFETIYYPEDGAFMLHKSIQSFKEIQTGDPLFVTLDGQIIPYKGDSAYPIFVKEAAYISENIAMVLTKKKIKEVNSNEY